MIFSTERLYLRELTHSDYGDLCKMLKNKDVMYAYEHAFDDKEAWEWLERQIARYKKFGYGLWAVIRKSDGLLIGQCGITQQDYCGITVPEIGYLFCKEFWHCGYAIEAAAACKEYAFNVLNFDKVYSIIRVNNFPSRRVAERNGMRVIGEINKFYYGMDMPHAVYAVELNNLNC